MTIFCFFLPALSLDSIGRKKIKSLLEYCLAIILFFITYSLPVFSFSMITCRRCFCGLLRIIYYYYDITSKLIAWTDWSGGVRQVGDGSFDWSWMTWGEATERGEGEGGRRGKRERSIGSQIMWTRGRKEDGLRIDVCVCVSDWVEGRSKERVLKRRNARTTK